MIQQSEKYILPKLPWPWSSNLGTETWPRHNVDVLPYQKFIFYIKSYSPKENNRLTHRQTDSTKTFGHKREIINQQRIPLTTIVVCGVQHAANTTNIIHKVFASLTELSLFVGKLLETFFTWKKNNFLAIQLVAVSAWTKIITQKKLKSLTLILLTYHPFTHFSVGKYLIVTINNNDCGYSYNSCKCNVGVWWRMFSVPQTSQILSVIPMGKVQEEKYR